MPAYLRKWISQLAETFWLLPGLLTLIGILGAASLVSLDRSGAVPAWLRDSAWVYNGGGSGARTLLGTVAASTIGVAGTVFSITIAALSLAAGQMGPRLLRNFTRDRGVQVTLGTFIGTFAYALMVLRAVRTQEEGAFTPQVSLTVGIALAFVCIAMLVYFVGHMANRINVDTVIDLVSADLRASIDRFTTDAPGPSTPPESFWRDCRVVTDERHGYLQQLDAAGLADWCTEHDTAMRLLVRPGDCLFPGAPVALITRPVEGAGDAIRRATALGTTRASSADPEHAVRQLVEVAVRALSPGINDPHTAISVLDRLGQALCEMAPRCLPTGVHLRNDRPVLLVPVVDYPGLADAMFHMIRQHAAGHTAVTIRLLEVMAAAASCERDPARLAALQRHAALVLNAAERGIGSASDLDDVRHRHAAFDRMRALGPVAPVLLAG